MAGQDRASGSARTGVRSRKSRGVGNNVGMADVQAELPKAG
jgi:hypothetical protein